MSPITKKTIDNILANLGNVREDLLTLSDVIWVSIDHNDASSLEEGVSFKKKFNALFEAFNDNSEGLEKLIQEFAEQGKEPEPEIPDTQRIIKELDKEIPHSIDEEFTFKRPYAFVLGDFASDTANTWTALTCQVCTALANQNFSKIFSLADGDELLTKQGNKPISSQKDGMRRPVCVACFNAGSQKIWVETNRSAQDLVKLIKALLAYYGMDNSAIKIYLREDRNA